MGPGEVLGFYSECDAKLLEGFELGYDNETLLKKGLSGRCCKHWLERQGGKGGSWGVS